MAFNCDVCGKGAHSAHTVSHSNIKTKRKQRPNLQRVHVIKDGETMHIRVCTRCLRSGAITKA